MNSLALFSGLVAVLLLSVMGFGMGWRRPRTPRGVARDAIDANDGQGLSATQPSFADERAGVTRRLVALRGGLRVVPRSGTRRVRAHVEVLRSTTASLPARRPGLVAQTSLEGRSKRLSVVR